MSFFRSPRQSSTRSLLFQLHLCVGLGSGLLMALMGVSGSVLVFTPEIDRAGITLPAVADSSLPPLQQTADRISTELDATVRAVRFVADEPRLVQFDLVTGGGSGRVFVDRSTSQVVKARRPAWFLFIYELHHDLFLGSNGRIITGILGLLLTLLAISGIVIWWPGRGRVAENPAFSPRVNRRVAWKLHHFTGFWSSLLLAVIAFTGTCFTWRAQYVSFFNSIARSVAPAAPPTVSPDHATIASLDSALAAAQHAVPDAEPTLVRLPARANDALSVRMRRAGDMRRIGAHTVYLHPSTGQVVRVDDFANASWATRFVESLAPVHTGEFGTGLIRWLWALAGIAPPVLFFSGFTLWCNKRAVRGAGALHPVLRPETRGATGSE